MERVQKIIASREQVPAGHEEGHFDAFEKQHENIQQFGPNYLALQSFEVSAAGH